MSLTAYPTDVTEAATVLASKLRGETVERNHLLHAGWNVIGFSNGILFPCDHAPAPVPAQAAPLTSVKTEADLLACCEHLSGKKKSASAAVGGGFDYMQIVLMLMELLKQWQKK